MSTIECREMKTDSHGHANRKADDNLPAVSDSLPETQGKQGFSFKPLIITPHSGIIKRLSLTDKLLTPIILLSMILGVIIGVYAPRVQESFDTIQFNGVSVREYSNSFLDLE